MNAYRIGLLATLIGTTALCDVHVARAQTLLTLDEVVVTASRREESNRQLSSTVQVIDEEQISKSSAKSVTDLLAENAVGFFSEWTAGQTSMNIRGGATEGQGKDYASEVLVLLNGRRAGTANISKLSLNDVERIEIVRGPASVAYGSQAMGGVVNIILRNGRNTRGGAVEARTGSWGLAQGKAYYGGSVDNMSYYAGIGGGHRDDYETGRNCIECDASNTSWTRASGAAAFSYDPLPNHNFDMQIRSDGHYKTGFRGSSADRDNVEDRSNQSFDFAYSGRTVDNWASWKSQLYLVHDIDAFNWGTEAVGTNEDNNERNIDIMGLRNTATFSLMPANDLSVGLDLERSTIRNSRYQITNAGVKSVTAPMDNNQLEQVGGIFIEDVHRFLDNSLAVRGGARYTYGNTELLRTIGNPNLKLNDQNYDALTYSAGASYLVTPDVKLRTGYSTGFRAPTGTELAADFTTVLGTQTIGNADLENETSQQLEVGVSTFGSYLSTDLALFQNVIKDRIRTVTIGPGNRAQFQNNPGDIVIRGLEAEANLNLAKLIGHERAWDVFGRLNYNYSMKDQGSVKDDKHAERIYESQGVIGTKYGERGVWEVGALGIFRGSIWYDTEETFVTGFESNSQHVYEKDPFWVFNLHARYKIADNSGLFGIALPKGLEFAAHVNNVFNENDHPIFIGIDRQPQILARGAGNSMPGREFLFVVRKEF